MKRWRIAQVIAVALGVALGYGAATIEWSGTANAAGDKECKTLVSPYAPVSFSSAKAGTSQAGHTAKAAVAQASGKKPNLLVIFGDDVGWFNPSCYHSEIMGYQTPNIDRIAKQGARFTGPRFGLIVHHTDAEREWAYDRESHIGRLDKGLDEAKARGWTVVDMKKDWNRVFPFDK